jgi:hypothetical protein
MAGNQLHRLRLLNHETAYEQSAVRGKRDAQSARIATQLVNVAHHD